MGNSGIKGSPTGQNPGLFSAPLPSTLNRVTFGGDVGNQSEPWMSWDFDSSRRIFTLTAGATTPSLNPGNVTYVGFTKDGANVYSVPSGKTFRALGYYRVTGLISASVTWQYGFGSCSSGGTPLLSGSTSPGGSPVYTMLGTDYYPSSANANRPVVPYSAWSPFFCEVAATRYPLYAVLSASTETYGSMTVIGYEY